MLLTKYEDSMPYGFRQEDFSMFLFISLYKAFDPRTGPFLDPGA